MALDNGQGGGKVYEKPVRCAHCSSKRYSIYPNTYLLSTKLPTFPKTVGSVSSHLFYILYTKVFSPLTPTILILLFVGEDLHLLV